MPSSDCLERPAGKHTGRLVVLACVIAFGISAGAESGLAEREDLDHVMNLAGMQGMLTQKMSSESLLVALGIDREKNLRNLEKTRALFDRTLKGLRYGNAALGLSPTSDPEVLDDLGKVEELWPLLDTVVRNSVAGQNVTAEGVDTIVELNLPLLKATDDTVKAYESAARGGNINLISMLAVALDKSGQQRMLTQKMLKEYLLIAYGYEVRKNRQNLRKTIDLFDHTLQGLMNGDNDQGILRAPTPEIRTQLAIVEQLWDEFRAQLEPFGRAGKPDPDAIANVAQQNLLLLEEMSKAATMYARL
jgi:hypothetical protein